MVSGGHLIYMIDMTVYSSTGKNISVQLFHVISHKSDMKHCCGDIGNTFSN